MYTHLFSSSIFKKKLLHFLNKKFILSLFIKFSFLEWYII